MTALPYPQRLLAIADFVALPEDDRHRWELQEGYVDEGESTGTFRTASPCPLIVELGSLA